MSEIARQISWVIECLIQEQPNKLVPRIIASRCGWSLRDVDDAIYLLVTQGKVMINPDSTLRPVH
jgi:hypothetical protein